MTASVPTRSSDSAWPELRRAIRRALGDPRTALRSAQSAVAAIQTLGVSGFLNRLRWEARGTEDEERYQGFRLTTAARTGELFHLTEVIKQLAFKPTISVVVPVHDTDPQWLRRMVDSVRAQVYPHWQLCLHDDGSTAARTREALAALAPDARLRVSRSDRNHGIAHATNAAIAAATGEYVAFLDHDDELSPDALAEVAQALNTGRAADVVYTDEDKIDASGMRRQPHFKPDWSPEQLRSCMYVSHLTAIRRQLVLDAGGLRSEYDGAQDFDLMLRVMERTPTVAHVPRVLYGWRSVPGSAASSQMVKPWAIEAGRRALEDAVRRQGIDATVGNGGAGGHYRIVYATASDRVSVLMAARTGGDRLAPAIAALRRHAGGVPFDLIVLAESTLPADARSALDGLPHTIVDARGDGNMARLLNQGAAAAQGDHLLVTDGRVEAIEDGWLQAMIGLSRQQAIGAVGAFLRYPDGTIEHGGVVLGTGGLAAHAFEGEPANALGHRGNALDVRNASAVSAACLMTRREVFVRLAGFADRFASDLFDVDYCLRVWQSGLRVTITPDARLVHHTARRGPRRADSSEAAQLRQSWGAALDADAFYNPNFERDSASFRLPPVTSAAR